MKSFRFGPTALWLIVLGTAPGGRSLAAPGDYDTSFAGSGGLTIPFTAGDDYAYSVAIQADGKILVAGGSAGGDYSVLRLLTNGTPDPNFGTAGKYVHNFGSFELARGVAEVGGGKIIIGGSGLIGGGNRDFAALRLLPGGTPDPGYGTGGLVTTDISGGFNEHVHCMAVDSGGRATLAGYYRTGVALVRYTDTGALDASFGAGGKVFTAATGTTEQQANAIALQTDGKVVVAGYSRTGSNTDLLVARFLANGTPDPDFGTAGQTITPIGAGTTLDIANAVAVLPDGKILVAGTTATTSYLLARYTSGGVLDPDFGTGGSTVTTFNGTTNAGYGLAVQSDGSILLAGATNLNARDYFGLLRYTAGGALDPGFGSGGTVFTFLTQGSDLARAVALQNDGKIVVAGYGGLLNAKDFAVARFQGTSPVTLAQWRQIHFGTTANSGNAANDFDFDKDGLVNLLEYAFGQNPTLGSSRTVPSGAVSSGNFVSSFTAVGTTGITYAAEWSTSLNVVPWTAVTDTGSGAVHTFSVPVAGKPKLYLRWKITAP